MKKLMNHRASTNALPLNGEMKLFDGVARKCKADDAVHRIESKKYLLFFKAGRADAIAAVFFNYTKL